MASSSRFRRPLLIALAFIVLAVLGVGLAARWALDPDRLRGVVEEQLARVLGQPAHVGRFDLSFLPRPRLTGADITLGGAAANEAPSLSLRAVTVIPQVAPLFSGRVVIERIAIEGLSVSARRDAEGTWRLPFAAAPAGATPSGPTRPDGDADRGGPSSAASGSAGGSASGGGPPVEVRRLELRDGRFTVHDDVLRSPAGSAEVATIDRISALVLPQADHVALEDLTARLGSSNITGSGTASRSGLRLVLDWDRLSKEDVPAVFGLLGAAAPAGFAVEGEKPLHLELDVAGNGALTASGRLAADTLRLDPLTLSALRSTFSLKGDELTLEPLAFSAYGGTQEGRVTVNTGASPPTWGVRSRLAGLDVNQLLSATTSAKDKLLGVGRLDANLRGTAAAPFEQHLAGTIDLALTKGVIKDFPLLANINRALGITEASGKDTAFESLTASLRLDGGVARTERLVLSMGELSVTARGDLRLASQALAVRGVATFSPEKSAQLIRSVHELSLLRNPQGEIEVPLSVSGTASAPEFGIDLGKLLAGAAKKQLTKEIEKGLKRLFKRP